MRKFLVLCVVLILTLISPIYAFADDPEESDSSGDRLATQEEIEQLDIELLQTADLVYASLSDNGTRATEYTTTDIYNWLNSYFGVNFNTHGSTYPALAYARLEQIRQLLTTINTSANGIAVNTTEIKQTLASLLDAINPDYDSIGISIYDLLHSCVTALTTIDPNDGDLTLVETLVYMYNELEDMNTTLSNILNSSYSIDNKLSTIYAYLANFRSDMNTGFSNVNANMALILTRLQSIQNDFNNVSWIDTNFTYTLYSSFDDMINNISNSSGVTKDLYIKFTLPSYNLYRNFYHFTVPFGNDNSTIITNPIITGFYRYFSSYSISVDSEISIISSDYYTDIYFDDYTLRNSGSNYYFYIVLHTETGYFSINYPNYNNHIFYLNSDSLDFYITQQYFSNKNFSGIFKKFELIYASDDLIAAKEDQQDYEDQAIQDFTGSGSAAATGQDLGDMKSISGAIKSGLQSGGSVNNALAPFNTNSGFWGWFSQSNYDNINNIPSSGTRSGNNSQPDIIDFYTNNQYTLQGLLSGGGN